MRREYHFWVYILASRSRNLYVGVTNSLIRRTHQHRGGKGGVHTAHYAVHRLVYYEYFQYVRSAIRRETELKRWTRDAKVALIEKRNPTWVDLFPELLREWRLGEADSPEGEWQKEKQGQRQRQRQRQKQKQRQNKGDDEK